jgi:hypothetical protein
MKEESMSRFGTAPWAKQSKNIIIGGVGGIGSWLALALARIGHNLYIYDMDRVDINNIGGQFYSESAVGKLKTEEMSANIMQFTGSSISTFGKYEESSMVSPIMISAFDNMEARRIMFDRWKSQDNREIFIDGRMTAEFFEVFAVTKGKEDEYEKFMFPSSEANTVPCSFKSTTHNAMGIAYIMTGVLNNYIANEMMREVPFHTKMNIALFMFEIQ